MSWFGVTGEVACDCCGKPAAFVHHQEGHRVVYESTGEALRVDAHGMDVGRNAVALTARSHMVEYRCARDAPAAAGTAGVCHHGRKGCRP